MGMKQVPGTMSSLTSAGAVTAPRRDRTSTGSPSATPRPAASTGWICTKLDGLSFISFFTRPVFVIVCHWCGSRPVVRTSGNSSSGVSAGGSHGRAWNRARRVGVGKASRGTSPDPVTNRSWLTPSLR